MATNMKSAHSKQLALRFLSISLLCAPFSFKYMACTVDLGPWGGEKGDFWELRGDIWKIYIEHGDVVDSLTIGYIKGGIQKKTVTLGRSGKNKDEIIFDKEKEHLVRIEGSVDTLESMDVVSSLTFITNIRPHGPFGKKSKREFSSPPVKAGKIAGLFGFVGKQLNGIGLSIVPTEASPVYVGPWGDHGGRFWEVHGDIRKITVQHGDVVDSLIINYMKGGIPTESIRFGVAGGNKEEEIVFGSDDYLVTIKGTVNTRGLVSSLTFITKNHPNGTETFGKESGEEFYLPVKETKCEGLFGFVGLHGMHLNAIGLSLLPTNGETVELGPWGGVGGTPWAYNEEIRSFQVASAGEVIVSITLNGTRFGGSGGNSSELVKLEPGEFLLSIEGAAGMHEEIRILQTISFVTNVQTHGPYGKAGEGAVPFGPPVKNGKIVGISGRQGAWIDAIAFKVASLSE